ncbi:hypothetical protein Pmani_025432 [Petrolisthes manimaculis]|uniref:Uncharacterized protein n=1 Tax=Petrolisthes manimaculis TaxID=1843537 RepID=A0AAE1P7X8_9EUCA|nr:hypothetical protein Pmani_025432 [Petrolisthes manimaculis]
MAILEMLSGVIYRFFSRIHPSMSSSFMLARNQKLINEKQITANNLQVFIDSVVKEDDFLSSFVDRHLFTGGEGRTLSNGLDV